MRPAAESGEKASGTLLFTIASTPEEFDQLDRLNHETFTREIPQHASSSDGRLRDAYHTENTYVVCKEGGRVVGMVALRDRRPFSLDRKLTNLDTWLPGHRSPCELRLLAVRVERRKSRVAAGLLAHAARLAVRRGHDLALISATTRQLALYEGMGFERFGPLVGTPDAPYQPMYLSQVAFSAHLRPRIQRLFPGALAESVNLLPGPPDPSADVRQALAAPPIHHRSAEFHSLLRTTQAMLCCHTRAQNVQIVHGSGTSANDLVAATLSRLPGHGIVASNGEFGERLANQAVRAALDFVHLRFGWGEPLDYEAIESSLRAAPRPEWLWCVHGETSTGVLNDLGTLQSLCSRYGARLCLDAVSSLGAVDVDLTGCFLATGSTGKALGAVPGLALIFHTLPCGHPRPVPTSLDLEHFDNSGGVPFSLSSALLGALRVALRSMDPKARATESCTASRLLRLRLPDHGLQVLAPAEHSFDAVATIPIPEPTDSIEVSNQLEARGFRVAAHSAYLKERNWIQVCFMSQGAGSHVPDLLDALSGIL